jgi:hypothetical protein
LKNIGNGLAQDINFYALHDNGMCFRSLINETNINQKHFSTEEIAKNETQEFYFNISYRLKEGKSLYDRQDFSLVLCCYKDLNGNEYKLLIGYIVKNISENEDGNIEVKADSYYLQENTDSYNKMIKKFYNNYTEIIKNKPDEIEIPRNKTKKVEITEEDESK